MYLDRQTLVSFPYAYEVALTCLYPTTSIRRHTWINYGCVIKFYYFSMHGVHIKLFSIQSCMPVCSIPSYYLFILRCICGCLVSPLYDQIIFSKIFYVLLRAGIFSYGCFAKSSKFVMAGNSDIGVLQTILISS